MEEFGRPTTILFFALVSLLLFAVSENIGISNDLNKPPKLIVISFDGFRPDYIKPDVTPNLYKLANGGVVGKGIKSVFGTKTFPNHMSIATGLYEESHGIIHNHMWDPVFNATFTWTNTESRWWDNNVSLPIWLANQRENDGKGRFSAGMMWPGSATQFKGQLPRHVFKYNHDADWSKSIDILISWLTHDTEPANCILVYFDQPDAMAHLYGPFSDQVMHEVRRADAIIGLLISQLKQKELLDETNIIVLSDHGMAEINAQRIIKLDTFLSRSLYDMYGASPLWNIVPHLGHEDFVFDTLLNASKTNHFFVYKKDAVPAEYHYRANRRIHPLTVVAETGYDIVGGLEQLGEELNNSQWGNHGYNNSDPAMQPLFIAHGPAFMNGLVFKNEFENVDLYPLMCYVLELLPISRFPSNGTLSKVAGMLKSISRPAEALSILPALSIVILGSMFICASVAICIVLSGMGKRTKHVEVNWDPGVTEFDFQQPEPRTSKNFVSSGKTNLVNGLRTTSMNSFLPEEAVLLLDDDDDELL